MGFFGAAQRYGTGGPKRPPLPKIFHTYPTMMKHGTVSYTLPKEDPKNI